MRKFTLIVAAAAALSANVAFAQDYTLNPAAGVATDLQGIVLTFPSAKVSYFENSRFPVAVLENVTTGTVYNCQEPDLNTNATLENGTEFKLVFIEENDETADAVITFPGEYVLTVRGLYVGEDPEADDATLPVITANYTIEYPVEYTLTPAAGAEGITNLQGITVSFEAKVNYYENNRMPVAVLENLNNGKVYTCAEPDRNTFAPTETGSEYTLVFLDADDEVVDITEPGNYLLTIRGLYTGGDVNDETAEVEDLPVILANYTIAYPYPYVLNPEPGVVTDLQDLSIDFTTAKVAFYENNRMPVAVLVNETTGVEYNCYEPTMNSKGETMGRIWNFKFVDEEDEALPAVNEPGNYTLTIRGAYYGDLTDEDAEVVDLPVITAKYVINYPVDYTLNPAAGSTVENLQGINIVFEEVVNFFENNRMPVAVLENLGNGKEYICYEPDLNAKTDATETGVEYTFMFMDEDEDVLAIDEPGNYLLTIRGLYVGEDPEAEDATLPTITANYTIAYPVAYLLDPANDAVVSEISEITINFYENKNVTFVENSQIPCAVITNGQEGDDEVAYTCEMPVMDTKAMSQGKVYTFKFVDEEDALVVLNEPGMWYLTIRNLALLEDIEDETEVTALPNIYAVYYVDGEPNEGDTSKVVDLTAPDGLYNVYSINGVQVVKNGNIDALKGLAKGIYVINGKKVVLK